MYRKWIVSGILYKEMSWIVSVVIIVALGFMPMAGLAAEDQSPDERDPFTTSEQMFEQAEKSRKKPAFVPSQITRQVPQLSLKGFIQDGDDVAVALLEVKGSGVFLVRRGDTISIQAGGINTVLKIKEINKLSVMVEVGTLGQVIVVR